MALARSDGWADGALNAALVVAVLLVGALLYGLASRAVTPRTTPVRAAVSDSLGIDALTGARVRVEVLNASGRDGLARAATDHLRRRGFDVLTTGTAPVQDTSAVVAQQGTRTDGHHVAGALGLSLRAVAVDSASRDYDPDVTVRLGRDYPDHAPFSVTTE